MENTRAYSFLFDFWSVLLTLPWRGNSNNNRNHPSNAGIVSIGEILWKIREHILILPWRGNSNNNRNHPSNAGIVSIGEILWKIREHIHFCLIFGAFFSLCPGGGTQTTTETTHRTLELYRSVKFYGKYASIFSFCPGGGTQTTTETTHRTLELYRSVRFYGKYASIFISV